MVQTLALRLNVLNFLLYRLLRLTQLLQTT
nr:MAG TPA: hypothetical protein [Caudoviricetes sp.]